MPAPMNPYRPPVSTVRDLHEPGADVEFRVPAQTVDAGRGISWIGEGWALFKMAPALWVLVLLIVFGIPMVLGMLPLIGSMASLLVGPLFMAGLLTFSHGLARGEEADIGLLFVGFREKTGALVGVALLYLLMLVAVVMVAAMALVILLGSASLFSSADPEAAMMSLMGGASGLLVLAVILAAALAMALLAGAYWFAPGLIYYTDLGPVAAMQASFAACLRNWLPFLLYSLISVLVFLGGMLALLIGLLVALPVLMASYYASFRDIFGRPV
jgi:uncharacterized membrane protein